MNGIRFSCALFISTVLSMQAAAAGFDCAKARSTVEFTICADPVLSELDSELKRVFDVAQSEHAGVNGDTGARIDPVGADQVKWVKSHRNKCSDNLCLRKEYAARIAFIKANWKVD